MVIILVVTAVRGQQKQSLVKTTSRSRPSHKGMSKMERCDSRRFDFGFPPWLKYLNADAAPAADEVSRARPKGPGLYLESGSATCQTCAYREVEKCGLSSSDGRSPSSFRRNPPYDSSMAMFCQSITGLMRGILRPSFVWRYPP